MIKKCICLLSLLTVVGSLNLLAQTQNQTDSIAKVNQQKQAQDSLVKVQMAQDSLKKVQAANTQKSEPAKTSSSKKDTRPLGQRIRFSFSSGFWIDVNRIYFEACPMLTYKFPKIWSIGTGPVYILNQDRKTNTTFNGWGGRIYGRADITKWLYGWTEYQGIDNQHLSYNNETNEFDKNYEYVDSWFLSLGVYIRLGRRALGAQALYDVLYKKDNSYAYSAWSYRLSFGF